MGLKTIAGDAFVRRMTRFQVQSGPFAGMKYVQSAFGSTYSPKLLGTYEKELTTVIESLDDSVGRIIDVGAAEGYYAVGLARRLPNCHVIAYDESEIAQALLSDMARLNGVVERISVRGSCNPANLAEELAKGPAFIIMDVERFEEQLLDPQVIPALSECPILVEIHDQYAPGVGDLIKSRFGASHDIVEYEERARTLDDFPLGEHWLSRFMPPIIKLKAMDEKRSDPMTWLHMTPG